MGAAEARWVHRDEDPIEPLARHFRFGMKSNQPFVSGIRDSEDMVDPAILVATPNLVHLAGPEGVRHMRSTGQRQKVGGKINQSLLTLSRVIQTLSQGGNAHVERPRELPGQQTHAHPAAQPAQ